MPALHDDIASQELGDGGRHPAGQKQTLEHRRGVAAGRSKWVRIGQQGQESDASRNAHHPLADRFPVSWSNLGGWMRLSAATRTAGAA